MEPKYQELLEHFHVIADLGHAASVLNWDQSTYMPPAGAEARAHAMATLQAMIHERAAGETTGRLLDDLQPYADSLPADSTEACLLRKVRRDYERWRHVPSAFVARFSQAVSQAHNTWMVARPRADFAMVAPDLERVLDLSRQLAEYLPRPQRGEAHIADSLIALSEDDMTAAEIRVVFDALRRELVPLVEAITAQAPADDACLRRHYPEAQQLAFCRTILQRMGYDFNRGRMDLTAHPFMTRFGTGDVRVTTRVREDYLSDCLFSVIHEGGHALYEQGVDPALDRTPVSGGSSAGVHESQSRLWENLVGRSRGFWEHFYPEAQRAFAGQLGDVAFETFYRAINKVERSLIRVDADEVTYNLHVLLRFDLELALLEGKLAVRDLPQAWNARMQQDLGVTPPNDRLGALQDIHWYWGPTGGQFQGYTLGNLLSAQVFESAVRAHPDIPEQIRRGEFDTLHGWLTENLYRHGSKFTASELVQRATGAPLGSAAYLRYLRGKYGELYPL